MSRKTESIELGQATTEPAWTPLVLAAQLSVQLVSRGEGRDHVVDTCKRACRAGNCRSVMMGEACNANRAGIVVLETLIVEVLHDDEWNLEDNA